MSEQSAFPLHRLLGYITLGLGTLTAALVVYAFVGFQDESLEGRLIPAHMRGEVPWKVLRAADVASGAVLPPDTNVIIEIPADLPGKVTRSTLFSPLSDAVRYWGYCVPPDYDREAALKKSGLPGKVFLSKAERDERDKKLRVLQRERFGGTKAFSDEELNELRRPETVIRHEIDAFDPGELCFVQSAQALPVGIDIDDDDANGQVERENRTNPHIADSDGDGLTDGTEIFLSGTLPLIRDTDGDGLIDGLEDRNRNGRREANETDPLSWDTDRDGLPDGLMRMGKQRVMELRGEDKNLNGIVDQGEFNPLRGDSDNDGVTDEQEYLMCKLGKGTNC